ncbi:hypothetical protein FQZ97_326650 [compost metagenome]
MEETHEHQAAAIAVDTALTPEQAGAAIQWWGPAGGKLTLPAGAELRQGSEFWFYNNGAGPVEIRPHDEDFIWHDNAQQPSILLPRGRDVVLVCRGAEFDIAGGSFPLAAVASTANYDDLVNRPALQPVATGGTHADLTGVQGGTASEQYHLTLGQQQSVIGMADSIEAARLDANATSLQGMALKPDGAAPNYTLKTRDAGGGALAVDFVPIGQSAVVVSGQQRYLLTETETLFGTPYYAIGGSPQAAADPFVSATNADKAADTDNLISHHVGLDRDVVYAIEAGTWTCKLWTQSSAPSGNTLKIVLERLDEATGNRTAIMTASYTVTGTVMSEDTYAFDVPRIDLAANERFALAFYCHSASNNRTITLNFGGSGFQSGVVVPDVLDHDELSNIKGNGTYHLSQAERDKLNTLAPVASSGNYGDLTGKPTIPAAQINADWNAGSGVARILNKPALATVATSGSYNDLSNKPAIPGGQVNADWNVASGLAMILNKPALAPVATSGSYSDLTSKPTIPAAQVNANWSAASDVAMILNKPILATVATTGNYADLSNKPAIPAAQVNADWNASSGVAAILNKPTISGGGVDVQVYTASGSWSRPANAKAVYILIIGGGGGGGGASGAVAATGVQASGGGGGGGGACSDAYLVADVLLPYSVSVNVGKGGVGGVGGTGGAANGLSGQQSYIFYTSGSSSVTLAAAGGGGGTSTQGGQGAHFVGGSTSGLRAGGKGGNGDTGSGASVSGLTWDGGSDSGFGGAVGGAGGGGVNAGNTANGGGAGYGPASGGGYFNGGNNQGGSPAQPPIVPGYMGAGGPGGGANASGNGGNGAPGGLYGGGGGGGGTRAGYKAGNGGDGAPGLVIFITYLG